MSEQLEEMTPSEFASTLDEFYESSIDVDEVWATAALNAMRSEGKLAEEWETTFREIGHISGGST